MIYFILLFLLVFILLINVIILRMLFRIYIFWRDFLNCFCYAIFCVV